MPKDLTRRMIFSKNGAIFYMYGKFAPITAGLKVDLRMAVKLTTNWDDPVPDELRGKWVLNFWRIEKLRGLKFHRAVMPDNAVNSEMDIIVAADASQQIKMVGAWGRFRLESVLLGY